MIRPLHALAPLALVAFAPNASSPAEPQVASTSVYVLPDTPLGAFQNAKLAQSIDNDRKILLGGIGSDLWHGPKDKSDEFWMVTDRGPNGQVKVGDETRRTFPVPGFDPTIVHVWADGGALKILDVVPLLTASGKPVSGLPNLEKHDETPYDFRAQQKLAPNPNGLDTEGLVRTSQGDFYLADEYAPSLVHVDKSGKVVKRYVPADLKYAGLDYPVAPALPALYAKRKANRGFEGLALSPDEKTVYIALQSPLSNPDKKTGDGSRNTRILVFDVASEKLTAEYLYVFEPAAEFEPKAEPSDMKISGLVALDATTLLVLERTDTTAKLYAASLAQATNLLATPWDDPQTAPSLEAVADLTAAKLTPLAKRKVIDLTYVKEHPDKIEGIAVIDASTIAFANDNDFDIGDFDKDGNNHGKGAKIQLLVSKLKNPILPAK